MKRSTQRILTTHVGSLTRPDDLMALYAANAPDEKLQPRLRTAVGDIVRQQAESGIDVVNDGEYGKAMRSTMDFGAWWSYVYPRLEGFELREEQAKKGRGAWTYGSKERQEFAEFYAAEASAAASAARQSGSSTAQLYGLTCTGPVKYVGHTAIKRDTENLAAAVHVTRAEDAFMTAVSPATLQILPNAYYKSSEDYTWALAEAIRDEYRAIVDAGFILQIDDPALVVLDERRHRRLSQMGNFPGRGVEPRAARYPRRSRAVPHLLGELARPAQRRRRTQGRDRSAA
jgi:5-methyltetrahydropteroyltriglutamate--homocysteine methyltransferase